MIQIGLGVALFTLIVLTLIGLILAARARLVASGPSAITVNGERVVTAQGGVTLLQALGAGALLPPEAVHVTRREAAAGVRLSCQVTVKGDMRITVPEEVFGVRSYVCRVRSNRNVATFIKELVLELAAGEEMDFRAGAYVQIECPPHHMRYGEIEVEPQFHPEWDRQGLWSLESTVEVPVVRAYSMANYPREKGIIMLNVRIATPPPSVDAPPGAMSSWLFTRKPGDEITVSGPFGEFFAREGEREMVFIGGGAGMAPMRSHILDQLLRIRTQRPISFWYGARNSREAFYVEEFEKLQAEHPNFSWHLAFSEPLPEDAGHGHVGFIHEVVLCQHLQSHPEPEECEYYICGPPMMNAAVIDMLHDLGVDDDRILLDDFGV